MPEELKQVGRLALRHEGDFWNAYYAMPNTMDKAIHLGSIRMAAVVNHAERKQAFMDLMRSMVSDILESKTGHRPTWKEPEAAPESERAGHA